MKTETIEVEGRRGRIFSRSTFEPDNHASICTDYADAEDLRREPLLAKAMSASAIKVTADPLVEMPDVFALYVQPAADDDPSLFACTIVSQSRLRQMLEEEPAVFENFTFQVAESETLTEDDLRAAFVTWAKRNFAQYSLSKIDIEVLPEHVEHPVDLLIDDEVPARLDTSVPETLAYTFTSFCVASPAWEEAA